MAGIFGNGAKYMSFNPLIYGWHSIDKWSGIVIR